MFAFRRSFICFVLTLIAGASPALAESLRVASYNITSAGGNPRAGLDTILKGIGDETFSGHADPLDIIAIQEVQAQSTTGQVVVNQLNALYGAGVYSRGSLNGGSTGSGTQGVVFNTQSLQLIGEKAISVASTATAARQTLRYQFRPMGGTAADDFYVYSSHWKAGTASDDRAQRLFEANDIRIDADAIGPNPRIIYTGDYNLQSSSETSFQSMLAPGNGHANDPVNRLGNWHDNGSFLDILTQAPLVSAPGGLTGGGLDDRFDFQLVSDAVLAGSANGLSYLSGSYHTFGNNGSVPLNGNVNSPSSTALAGLANRTQLLDLLTTVSDHLPVVADYSINVPEPGSIVIGTIGITLVLGRRPRS